jgi:hypothetical protein
MAGFKVTTEDVCDQFYRLYFGHVSYIYFPVVSGMRVKRYLVSVRRPLRTATLIVRVRNLYKVASIAGTDPYTLYA